MDMFHNRRSIASYYKSCIDTLLYSSLKQVVAMENSQTLSIESFSYSWLVNLKPSFEDSFRASIDASDEASFIEMDPKSPPSKRFFGGAQDFNFDFPTSESPLTLVHADELISNGFVLPLFLKQLEMETYSALNSIPSTPISSQSRKDVHSDRKLRCSSLRRCRRLSKRLFQKYMDFLWPLCRKFQCRRSGGARVETVDTEVEEEKQCVYSPATSPRKSVAFSGDNWRRSCDSDSSIYEAVLHCKRSIGK